MSVLHLPISIINRSMPLLKGFHRLLSVILMSGLPLGADSLRKALSSTQGCRFSIFVPGIVLEHTEKVPGLKRRGLALLLEVSI